MKRMLFFGLINRQTYLFNFRLQAPAQKI